MSSCSLVGSLDLILPRMKSITPGVHILAGGPLAEPDHAQLVRLLEPRQHLTDVVLPALAPRLAEVVRQDQDSHCLACLDGIERSALKR